MRGSERGDVIECVVQFLADGLVLHLLRIDFVWRGSRNGWECGEREQRGRGKAGERIMERENENQREVGKDK